MLRWLKRRLRKWLGIESESVSPIFDAVVDGEVQRVVALRSIGLGLVCKLSKHGGASERFILKGQACDREHYQQLLKHFGGLENLVWGDGTRYGTALEDKYLGEKYDDK